MRLISVLFLSSLSLCALAESLPKDLKVFAEPRSEGAEIEAKADKWLAHVGYTVINPACVTVTVNGESHKFQIPEKTQLMSISADGKTALLIRPDRKLTFANLASGELKNSDLAYAHVLKRWEVGDTNPARRVHLLALHGEGSERDKILFDRRIYYGILNDTYKENGKVAVHNMDGSLKMTCDFTGIDERELGAVDSRYEFINQVGPILDDHNKSVVDFVIYNSGLMGHIDLWTGYYSVQKREKPGKTVLSGFCK